MITQFITLCIKPYVTSYIKSYVPLFIYINRQDRSGRERIEVDESQEGFSMNPTLDQLVLCGLCCPGRFLRVNKKTCFFYGIILIKSKTTEVKKAILCPLMVVPSCIVMKHCCLCHHSGHTGNKHAVCTRRLFKKLQTFWRISAAAAFRAAQRWWIGSERRSFTPMHNTLSSHSAPGAQAWYCSLFLVTALS